MCEGMVAPAVAYTNVVPSEVDTGSSTFYTVLPAVTSNSTCSGPLCTCVNATSKAIKQAPVPRVSPACLDMIDESQSLYCFPPWDTEILSSCFSHSCLTRRLFFSSWTQWGFIGLKVLSLKMPKWIPNVQILEDIKGESHTWIGNTLFGLSTEDFLAIFHTFMQIKKEFMTGIMLLSFHLEALGRDKHAYFVHFTLYFPVLIFSCLNFPLLGLNFRIWCLNSLLL